MQRSPRPSSKAISTVVEDRGDPTLPVILEFQSPSTAIITAPVPRSARGIVWIVGSMLVACPAGAGPDPGRSRGDRAGPGGVALADHGACSRSRPRSCARSTCTRARRCRPARCWRGSIRPSPRPMSARWRRRWPACRRRCRGCRRRATASRSPIAGIDPNLALAGGDLRPAPGRVQFQAGELHAEDQRPGGRRSPRRNSDAAGYRNRLAGRAAVSSRCGRNWKSCRSAASSTRWPRWTTARRWSATCTAREETARSAQRDLAALVAERDGYVQSWHADICEKLADATGKLSDARESLNKAQLRRQLVELRADRDATVLTVAKVSVGSVLQSGQQFITLVPADAPLEVEANISGTRRRLRACRRSGGDQVRHLPVHPVRHGLRHGAHDQRGQLHRAGRAAESDRRGAAAWQQHASRSTGRASRSTGSSCMARRTGFRIVPGMPVTADIKVGKRTVLHYLLGRALPVASEGMREP